MLQSGTTLELEELKENASKDAILSWEDVRGQITDSENYVLLGNGFSISYKAEDFNQKKILEQMPSLEGKNDINDIEECIEATVGLVDKATSQTASVEMVAKWIKTGLHREFIETLFARMPKSIRQREDFNENTLKPYKKFLSNFKQIFTLNYDPLLYWMSLYFKANGDTKIVKLIESEKILCSMSPEDKKYPQQVKTIQDNENCCKVDVRNDLFKKSLNEEDYDYRVYYRDNCVLNKNLSKKEASKIMTNENVENIYTKMSEDFKENPTVQQELERINNYTELGHKTKKDEISANDDDIKVSAEDGFKNNNDSLEWNAKNPQSIFYLHGAYHIFSNEENTTIKIKNESDTTMLKEVQNKMDENFYPLTILESHPEKKLEEIGKRPYLNHCLERFQSIKGNLVTLGASFLNSDKHIIEAINNNSNIKNIFIGFYEDDIPMELLNAFKENEKVQFFRTKDVFI